MTAIEWLVEQLRMQTPLYTKDEIINEAKELEKQQKGYSEEEAYKIWKAGQEYWRTSGDSITFEELTEQFKKK